MAEISAAVVKELRERTGSGMMDCKKALAETGGDMEKAIDYLREKGLAKAAKKAERTASDGRIFQHVSADGKLGVLLELNSETDFVAKTDEFNALGQKIVSQLAAAPCDGVEALMEQEDLQDKGKKIKDQVTAMIAKLGENIVVRRFARFTTDKGHVACYVHNNYKVGALLELSAPGLDELGHEITMQIAAASPSYIRPDEVTEDVLNRERDIYRQQLIDEGKPADRLDKIIEGKLRKYYEQNCLNEQEYIRDSNKKVKDLLKEAGAKAGGDVVIERFVRFSIGE